MLNVWPLMGCDRAEMQTQVFAMEKKRYFHSVIE